MAKKVMNLFIVHCTEETYNGSYDYEKEGYYFYDDDDTQQKFITLRILKTMRRMKFSGHR